jgi:ABC-type multidrug transport system ATPase subunit
MFSITLKNIGKRYRYDRIFTGVDVVLSHDAGGYAILGPNGSGKSTLMKILSGHLTPSVGNIVFSKENHILEIDQVYQHISYDAPYIDVIEEMTLVEMIDFHQKFKPLQAPLTATYLINDVLNFKKYEDKFIKHFSSGMKQRLKLALAITSDTPVLLLDEPTSYLDEQGCAWYLNLIQQYTHGKLIVIASNSAQDYGFCKHHLNIMGYKGK